MRLELADRLDRLIANDLELKVNARDMLKCIHDERARGAQARGSLAGHHGAVGHDHGAYGATRQLLPGKGGRACRRVILVDTGLLHNELETINLLIAHAGTAHIFDRGKVAADDLHLGSVAAGIVIGNGKTDHIDAHVRGALVGALAQDLFHQSTDHRESLDVTVVVDRGLVVGLQVEGVDDIGIVEVGRGGLVGDVDRMREGQIPDRESLELGVAGGGAVLVLVIELRQAGGELT